MTLLQLDIERYRASQTTATPRIDSIPFQISKRTGVSSNRMRSSRISKNEIGVPNASREHL
jgi:hypothetical protein